MKVLFIHNFHHSGAPSGDDNVVKNEIFLLNANADEVDLLSKYNDDIDKWNIFKKVRLYFEIPWSKNVQKILATILKNQKYDIVHIHNIFPQFSISIYETLKRFNLPFVHTLHDFRLFCANAFLFRNSKICEICPRSNYLHSVKYKCFQNSYLKSIPVAFMLKYFKKRIEIYPDYYIILTQFAKAKLKEFGISEQKIIVKPNFVCIDKALASHKDNYALFVGRLSAEKGIDILLQCLDNHQCRKLPIKIVGDGPLYNYVKDKVARLNLNRVELLGMRPYSETMELLKHAKFLTIPSLCYEGFPMTLVESMAVGTPVVASEIGALGYLIRNNETGILSKPGDVADLRDKIVWLWDNPDKCRSMEENARREYEEKYTPEKNYEMLMDIYKKAIDMHKKGR